MSSPHATEEAAPRASASDSSEEARPAAGAEVLAMGGGGEDSRGAGSSAGERPAAIIAATSRCRRRAAAATRREGMARTWRMAPRMASCIAPYMASCLSSCIAYRALHRASHRAMHRASCHQRWRVMAHRGVEGGTSHSGRHMQTSAAQVDPRRLAREGGARRELEHAASHCRRASQLQRMAACLLPEAHLAQTHARPTPYWPHRRQTQRGGGKAEPAYGALRRAAVRGRHLKKTRQRTVH